MAKSDAVWGIDVGQCALKALRCRAHDDGKRLVAEAFDFIEYPKILSQPDADPAELVGDAIEQFLSRNDVKGDKVAISVSGQSGLARFIKLPPVESKKIPDIVKFEARQQIPFALEDVVWDFQQMAGRQRGRRLRAGDRSRLVRDEARPGVPRAAAVHRTPTSKSISFSSRRSRCTTTSSSTRCRTCRRRKSSTRRTRRRASS